MLQSRKSWFEVVIYVLKNLPGTQHMPSCLPFVFVKYCFLWPLFE